MRWDNFDHKFIRPIRWLLALWGDEIKSEVIPIQYAGVQSDRTTFGHRFLTENADITIAHPLAYEKTLEENYVLPNSQKRKSSIEKQLTELTAEYHSFALSKTNLLDVVNNLVEYPVLIVGEFKKQFLEMPKEVLISEMIEHQKYFPLCDATTKKLIPHFIITANLLETESVRTGNNNVLNARLNDGLFFYEQDLKTGIDALATQADKVVYHRDLGSYAQKIERILTVSRHFNEHCHFAEEETLEICVRLLKADLFSRMVYEFPELQGIIGESYICSAGYDEDIARASKEHYYPITGGGKLPSGNLSLCSALADKLDDLLACFSVGIQPTGSNDPYGLRRKTQGLLRIWIENKINLDFKDTVETLYPQYEKFLQKQNLTKTFFLNQIFTFIESRLKTTLKDYGFSGELIEAALTLTRSLNQWNFHTLNVKLMALKESMKKEHFQAFTIAYRRVANILKKNRSYLQTKITDEEPCDLNLLSDEFEKKLYHFHLEYRKRVQLALSEQHYVKAYEILSEYHAPLSNFFEHVFVEVDDIPLKKNRLQLLQSIENSLLDLPIIYS